MTEDAQLKECVKTFFNKYLNYKEESDNGTLFHPVTISVCRVMMIEPLEKLLTKMQELSGAEPLSRDK